MHIAFRQWEATFVRPLAETLDPDMYETTAQTKAS